MFLYVGWDTVYIYTCNIKYSPWENQIQIDSSTESKILNQPTTLLKLEGLKLRFSKEYF